MGKPAPERNIPKPDMEETVSDIYEHFSGKITPVRSSPVYILGLLIVAFTMLLLPLIYLGLIGLASFLVYYHAMENVGMLNTSGGFVFRIAIYIAPLIGGSLVVLFMLKPFFARRARHSNPYALEPGQAPHLYAFVRKIAESVNAPTPSRIELNCIPNASASFRRGILSMFGSDVVLTLGTPLIEGMNTRQLAGVIAHELGHFSQGAGMRLTYIIRSINYWFLRVASDRDAWDQKLIDLTADSGTAIGSLILLFSRFCIWFTRLILKLFMILGEIISSFMLRQMEYDADVYEARLVGSDAFESTSRRLMELSLAHQSVFDQLNSAYAEGRLPDNMPMMMSSNAEMFNEELKTYLKKLLTEERTGFFDSHPSTPDRIARAKRDNSAGVFHLEQPASSLIANFEVICKWTTMGFYHSSIGPQVKAEQLVSTSIMLSRQKMIGEGQKAIFRYMQGAYTLQYPLNPASIANQSPATSPTHSLKQIHNARKYIRANAPALRKRLPQIDEAHECWLRAEMAIELSKAGYEKSLKAAELPPSRVKAEATVRKARDHLESTRMRFQSINLEVEHRLATSLQLLRDPALSRHVKNADRLLKRAERMLSTLRCLSEAHDLFITINRRRGTLIGLLSFLDSNEENDAIFSRVDVISRSLHADLSSMKVLLSHEPYPFEHSGSSLTLSAYAIEILPAIDQPIEIVMTCHRVVDMVSSLHERALGMLVLIAEKVEKMLKLPPLDPPSDEADNPGRHLDITHQETADAHHA